MIHSGWLRAATATATLLLVQAVAWPAPVPPEKSGLREIPATAPLVIHLRGIEGPLDRFINIVSQVSKDRADKLRADVTKFLKNGQDGRKFSGLAKDGPILVFFPEMPKPGEEPKVAVIAAVTNYQSFRDNILKDDERKKLKANDAGVESTTVEDKEIHFLNRQDFAIVTNNKELAGHLAKRPRQGIDGKISKELASKLLSSDFGVYLSMDVFNKDYAAQIKAAREAAEEGIKALKEQVGKEQQASFEIMEKAIGPIFQAVEDSQGVLLTVELRPAGVGLHIQSEVRANTPTNQTLKTIKTSSFRNLADLPSGLMFYTGMENSPSMLKALGSLTFGALAGDDEKQAKALKEAVDELAKAGPSTRMDAVTVPPAGIQIWTYAEPAKAVDAQMKLVESLVAGSLFQSGTLKEKPVIKTRAEKLGDFEFHSVKLVWDLEKMLGPQAQNLPEEVKKKLVEGMQKLLGEGTTIWFGTDGKQYVQLTAPDWAAARKLLEEYLKKQKAVGMGTNFKDVRKELPAETTIVALVDLVKYGRVIVEYVKPLLAGQFPLPANYPAQPTGKDSYIGLAVTLLPERGSFDLYVSAAAMKAVNEAFVEPFFKPKD